MHPRHTACSLTFIFVLALTLLAACGSSATTTTGPTAPADGPQGAAQLFEGACASCHGPRGQGGRSGVALTRVTAADRQLVIDAIRHGVGGMPASSGGMSDEQIRAVADYVVGLR